MLHDNDRFWFLAFHLSPSKHSISYKQRFCCDRPRRLVSSRTNNLGGRDYQVSPLKIRCSLSGSKQQQCYELTSIHYSKFLQVFACRQSMHGLSCWNRGVHLGVTRKDFHWDDYSMVSNLQMSKLPKCPMPSTYTIDCLLADKYLH